MLLGEYRLRLEGAGWLPLPGGIRNALHELSAPDDTALIVSMFFEGCLFHIPPDFVVDHWASDGERSSHRPYLWQYDVWTMLCRRIREEII